MNILGKVVEYLVFGRLVVGILNILWDAVRCWLHILWVVLAIMNILGNAVASW